MAKHKVPDGVAVPTAEELEREVANAAADAARKRRGNAEKQARFRKSMKEQGYREVKYWEKPHSPSLVKPWGKLPPPLIQESSASICEMDQAIGEAIRAMMDAFFVAMRGENDNMSKEAWRVYRDIETLLSPLGYKNKV
jgi:hypothetical protein